MTLENLRRINQLHNEPADPREFSGLVRAALDRLADAQVTELSYASRFDLAYSAAHGFALAALRAAGYRTDKRYLVFQCLVHTVDFSRSRTRILTVCHEKRNLAEYEGCFEIDEQLLSELIDCTRALSKKVGDIQL